MDGGGVEPSDGWWNFQLTLPVHVGDDGEEVGWVIVGMKDRMREMQCQQLENAWGQQEERAIVKWWHQKWECRDFDSVGKWKWWKK